MPNYHLKTGVDSTPKTCEKHFRQWILSNKFMLQIGLKCLYREWLGSLSIYYRRRRGYCVT